MLARVSNISSNHLLYYQIRGHTTAVAGGLAGYKCHYSVASCDERDEG